MSHLVIVGGNAGISVALRARELDSSTQVSQIPYDRLILATGARSRRPRIAGFDLPGVFLLHAMEKSFQMQHYLSTHSTRSALIVGGGYIGLEMADALTCSDEASKRGNCMNDVTCRIGV